MNLIAFFSRREILSIGLLAGEPTKGPLLKTIEAVKPPRLLLIAKNQEERGPAELQKLMPADVEMKILFLDGVTREGMSSLVNALKAQAEVLAEFSGAAILNAGTPQERAALWILKHEGILKGEMVEAPEDYEMIDGAAPCDPAAAREKTPKRNSRVEEPPRVFGENSGGEIILSNSTEHYSAAPRAHNSPPWEIVARKTGCIGKSARYRQTLIEAATLAAHPTPILLTGETGSGKEVLAHFIHEMSLRAGGAFVAVNCAALPETLAESILFGHEKGSFTGAYRRQKGKFELAEGGTLFLDELGELSLPNQAKLLRALDTRCVDSLGGAEPVKVDVRVIAATNRNLQQEVAAGRFREDLYYRLRAGEVDIPPLRERTGDIAIISLHLLQRFNATLANPKQFSKPALKFLEAQRWTGNVRDLLNTIERAALLCPRTVIEPEDFKIQSEIPRAMLSGVATGMMGAQGGSGSDVGNENNLPSLFQGFSIEDYLQKIRRELFEKALKQANGNKSEAARLLGISPQAMHKYFKQTYERRKEEKEASVGR